MIEFRWFVGTYVNMNDTLRTERKSPPVLQYRMTYDPQITAGLGPHAPSGQSARTDWITVPTIISDTPMYV